MASTESTNVSRTTFTVRRLYKAQGINTQNLPGHKSPQQTAKYHDDRGKDWKVVTV